ncbi:MAG: hypothetical protein GY854_18775 [Deltaproteobacteria bacterium]|nr:hypothetical protein [Deltaproteobacteria bacterium]
MDCEQARMLFLGYHDDDIGDGDRRDLENHLKECEECKAEWDDYRRTVGEVSGLLSLAPSEDFTSRVKETIGRRSRGRFFGEQRPFSLWFAIISFILILLVMLGYLFISAGTEIHVVPQKPEDGATSPDKAATE